MDKESRQQESLDLMISVCGGKEKYDQLPELKITKDHYRSKSFEYVDNIMPGDMSASVMRFTDLMGRPGIAIRAQRFEYPEVQAFFQRYYLEPSWTDGGSNIISVSGYIINNNGVQEESIEKLRQLIKEGQVGITKLV
jgi:hypothetical protein